jgi:ABC-type glycerol-3-phosphate transport system permease component
VPRPPALGLSRVQVLPRYALVAVLLALVLFPFYWMVVSSIKSPPEILRVPPTFVPRSFTVTHYVTLFGYSDYPRFLRNSVLVALLTMAVTVTLSTLAAYAIYRVAFPGRQAIFRIILVTYVFPGVLLLVPLFRLMAAVRLLNTLAALVVVNVTFAAPFGVWLLQAFFRAIPGELEEAAALDGAGRLRTLVQVILPLALPGLATVAIYAFITAWTEFMFASVLITEDARRTLPVGLAGIIGQYQVDWGLLNAGAVVMTLPVLAFFALAGRTFVEGLTQGATQ